MQTSSQKSESPGRTEINSSNQVNATNPTITTKSVPASVPLPPQTGTLSIKLVQAPPPEVHIWENPTLWIALLSLAGVVYTVFRADRRSKRELDASESRTKLELNASEGRLRSQLDASAEEAKNGRQHSREEGHLDRITEGRRVTYLEAVSELVKAQAFLGTLPARDLQSLETTELLHGFITAVGKITILGSMDTVLKARALNDAIQASFHRCMLDVSPLVLERAEIESLAKAVKSFEVEKDRLSIELIRCDSESSEFAALNRSLEICVEKIGEISGILAPKYSKQVSDRLNYGLKLLDEAKEIARLTDELISSVRTELNLETSKELLAQSTAVSHNAATAVLAKAKERFDQPKR